MLKSLSHLRAQLEVQRVLQTTAELLRQHPIDKSLPNQLASRVKHFVKYVFGNTSRQPERQSQLRKLDCNALKLCGLSYTIRNLTELPAAEFNFLVENVADFTHRRKLTQHLYRDDINKVIYDKYDLEDEDLFKEFLKSHIWFLPTKRKRDACTSTRRLSDQQAVEQTPSVDSERSTKYPKNSGQMQYIQSATTKSTSQGSCSKPMGITPASQETQHEHPINRPSNESCPRIERIDEGGKVEELSIHSPRAELERISDISSFLGPDYYHFSFTRRNEIECLPDLFLTGLKMSSLWKEETERGGLAVTNCLSMFLPKRSNKDALFLIRMGYYEGFQISNMVGLGEPDTAV